MFLDRQFNDSVKKKLILLIFIFTNIFGILTIFYLYLNTRFFSFFFLYYLLYLILFNFIILLALFTAITISNDYQLEMEELELLTCGINVIFIFFLFVFYYITYRITQEYTLDLLSFILLSINLFFLVLLLLKKINKYNLLNFFNYSFFIIYFFFNLIYMVVIYTHKEYFSLVKYSSDYGIFVQLTTLIGLVIIFIVVFNGFDLLLYQFYLNYAFYFYYCIFLPISIILVKNFSWKFIYFCLYDNQVLVIFTILISFIFYFYFKKNISIQTIFIIIVLNFIFWYALCFLPFYFLLLYVIIFKL